MGQWRKRNMLAAVMAVSMTAVACSGGGGMDKEASVRVREATTRNEEKSGIPESSGADGAMSRSDAVGSASTVQNGSGNTSTVQNDDGTGAASQTGKAEIEIVLPENDDWYSNPVCSREGGTVRQILFHDEITGSDAVVRASKKEDGDPSVFFYVFDDSKKERWPARAGDGTPIEIAVEVTVENSDIHGVLATWEHEGILYALWEDDAADAMDSVAKIAMEIAEGSS